MRPRARDQAYDPDVVQRLVDALPATKSAGPADLWEAVRRLNATGFADGQIAYRLGCSRRHVQRIRAELGLPPVMASGTDWKVDAPTLAHWKP